MDSLVKDVIKNSLYVWTPKFGAIPKVTAKYWMWIKNGMVIFDPEKIAENIKKVKNKVDLYKKEKKDILVIYNKEYYSQNLEDLLGNSNISYLNNKVPSWVFTNFDTIKKRINSMNTLSMYIQSDEFLLLTKKERLTKIRQLKKLETVYNWVKKISKLPDLVIIVDWKFNEKVVKEVLMLDKVDIIVVANSDFDKWINDDNLLVANTLSHNSINFILNYLLI